MASRKIEDLTPELGAAVQYALKKWEALYPSWSKPIVTCTHRDNAEQARLHAQPTDGIDNDKDGKIDEADEFVTNAKAGESYHNFYPSRAVDIAFVDYDAVKKSKSTLNWSIELFRAFSVLLKEHNPKIKWGAHKKHGGDFSFNDAPHYQL